VRIADIVAGLRQYARTDGDDIGKVDVHRVILDTVGLIKTTYKNIGIPIEVVLASKKGFVRGNFGKLQQVLMNLFANSRDALENVDRGAIKVDTIDDSGMVVRVSDNGSGIPPDKIPIIFDAFYTTKPVGKGTGLGLSISHSIIESFGGTIKVESEVGRGTTFIIHLISS
jgi:C4-dicarboxylate-specific signal transduction histidine kinase